MIPTCDRMGQIRSYTRWLEDRFDTAVRGMWVAERVWEQSFTGDLTTAGIEYTILDDFHFKNAGLTDAQLAGHLLTEDEGRVMSVLPGSERLRYLIPFGSPEQTIEHPLRLIQPVGGNRDRGAETTMESLRAEISAVGRLLVDEGCWLDQTAQGEAVLTVNMTERDHQGQVQQVEDRTRVTLEVETDFDYATPAGTGGGEAVELLLALAPGTS